MAHLIAARRSGAANLDGVDITGYEAARPFFKYPMNRALLATVLAILTMRLAGAADFATEMMEATFKIKGDATCFFLKREAPDAALYLVTAGHAFSDPKAKTLELVLRKPKPDGSYERVEHTISLLRDNKPLWVRHEKHDVTVLRISDPLPVQIPALPASVLADEVKLKATGVHLCSPLFVLAYPAKLEANKSGLPIARQGIFASPPLLPAATHPTFLADYNAFPGDSGGPVFIKGADHHPLVAGIVSEQHYYDAEMNSVFQQHSIRTPLGVTRILHAQYVRETLEAAAKQNASPSK
jgi:hypothetical protein